MSEIVVQARPAAGGRSPLWPSVRRAHLEKCPTCAACGEKEHAEVHHIEPVHVSPDKELDGGNLITLCDHPSRRCHWIIGHLGLAWSRWNPRVAYDAALLLDRRNESRRLQVPQMGEDMDRQLMAAANAAHEAGVLTSDQRNQLELEAAKLGAVNWLFLLSLLPVLAKFIPGLDKWLPFLQPIIDAFRGIFPSTNGDVPTPH